MAEAETIPLEGEDPPPAPAPSPPPPVPVDPAKPAPIDLLEFQKQQLESTKQGLREAQESAERSRLAREAEEKVYESYVPRMREKLAEPLPPIVQRQLIPPMPQRHYLFGDLGSNAPGNQWIDTITKLGFMGGGASRANSVGALTAMSSMLKAMNDNNDQAYKDALTTWRGEAERIRYNNTQEVATYNDILNRRDRSMRDLQQDMELAALSFHNRQIMEKARMGDLNGIANWLKLMETNIKDLEKSQLSVEVANDPGIHRMAMEFYNGDSTELGKGAGPKNRPLVAREYQRIIETEAAVKGITVDQAEEARRQRMLQKEAELKLTRSEAGTLGTMTARAGVATREVAVFIPLARNSAREVSKIADFKWTELNQLRNLLLEHSSNPAFYAFLTNNESLLNAWGRAMNPQGLPRVAQIVETRKQGLLSRATSFEAYDAMLTQIDNEVNAVNRAVEMERRGLIAPGTFDFTTGYPPPVPAAPVAPPPASPPSATTPPPGARRRRLNPATGKLEEVP